MNTSFRLVVLVALWCALGCAGPGAAAFERPTCQRQYNACVSSCADKCESRSYGSEDDLLPQIDGSGSGTQSGQCMQCLNACRDTARKCDEETP